jgi:hypothetical protein
MKFTQKSKYFVYGVIVTAVLVPLGTYAIKTIPLTFAEGDVMSASVLNALMGRIENATSPLTADDLVGTWTLTQIVPISGTPTYPSCVSSNTCIATAIYTDSADGLSRSRTDTVVISKSGSTYNFAQTNNGYFSTGTTLAPQSGTLGVLADSVLFKPCVTNSLGSFCTTYFYDAKKKSSNKIILTNRIFGPDGSAMPIGSTQGNLALGTLNSSFNIIILDRKNTAPAPADAVSATVSGTSVALAWTDQSIDETGFKVQYKTSVKGSWTTSATASANATTYTITGLTAGTYWIRVIATNTYGDAISSSEIQAVLQ